MESVHPSEQELSAYGLGKLQDARAEEVGAHLESCPACRRRAAEAAPDSFLGRIREARGGGGAAATTARSAASPARPADPSPVGSIPKELAEHPDYEVLRELGRGGMGIVYLAHNRMMGRDEVLKVMGPHIIERPGVLDRFQREIRAVARLRHPNIVMAYSAFRLGGGLAFAMEYVNGMDLARLIKVKGPLPVLHAAYFTHQAALGLQHAHERGMVHRDIKPHNLMLSHDGKFRVIKVLDFGLAKATREGNLDGGLTHEGQALGTPDYVAPEQIVNAPDVDVRADIYSLGCSLYFLLAGRPPFQGNSLYDLFQAHMSREAGPLDRLRSDVPTELAALAAKMMAKDPDRRFQTPGEVAQALSPFFKNPPKVANRPTARPSPPREDRPAPEIQFTVEGSVATPPAEAPQPLPSAAPRGSASPEAMWASLIDFRDTENGRSTPAPTSKKAALTDPRALVATASQETETSVLSLGSVRKRIPPWAVVAVGAALLGLSLLWVLGQVLIRTPYGTIRIDDLPTDAVVTVDGQAVQVAWTEGNPGDVSVQAGPHGLEVRQGRVKLYGQTVAVEAGKTFTVHLDKPASEPVVEQPLDPSGSSPTGSIAADDVPTGFKSLFNGRDLTGWQANPVQPGDWRVENGVLIGSAEGISHLYSERGDYKDFHLVVEARINERGNSGVFVRSTNVPIQPLGAPRWPDGYEAQINSLGWDPNRTGGLYIQGRAVASPPQRPPAPDEWFKMDVIAEGNHLRILVDGRPTTDYVDEQRLARTGHIALQVHDWQSRVEFRKIEIKELGDGEATVTNSAPAAPSTLNGFTAIFNGRDLSGWKVDRGEPARWRAREGDLIWNGSSDHRDQSFLLSDRDYKDFVLRFEFQMEKGSDGGVVFRAVPGEQPTPPEINLRDFDEPPGEHAGTAALRWSTDGKGTSYLAPAIAAKLRPNGVWNTMEVDLQGDTLKIKVNDVLVQGVDLAVRGQRPTALAGLTRKWGRIGFQCHSGTGRIRNVEIRELDLAPVAAVASAPAPETPSAPTAGRWPADAKVFRGAHFKVFPQRWTWHQAAEECRKMGGRLAVVHDAAVNAFLVQIMREEGLNESWLGATDAEVEGQWKWVDGSSMTYEAWAPGQPTNRSIAGGVEHYLLLSGVGGAWGDSRWNDVPAFGEQNGAPGFVCEWPAVVSSASPVLPLSTTRATQASTAWPADARVFRGAHYKLFEAKTTWHEAVTECRRRGGRLVIVPDEATHDFLFNYMKQEGASATWLGATDEQVEGQWKWIDGSPVIFTAWASGQPTNKAPGDIPEHYLMLYETQGEGEARWNDVPAGGWNGQPRSFICEWPAVPHPWPDDAREFQGAYYKLFPRKWSWHQAVDACRKMGGRLVVVHDAAEDAFVRSLLKEQNVEATWIGASDEKVEGNWVWLDGSPMTYTNWNAGQPNNKGDGEHYAVLADTFEGKDFGGRWADQPNVSAQHAPGFVCQWPATTPVRRTRSR